MLGLDIDLLVALDSKDLFEPPSKFRNSVDRSIRRDVSVILYEFETQNAYRVVWIPGKVDLADALTAERGRITKQLFFDAI